MRVALESDLYFEPESAEALLARVDQRVLNPLVKPGPVEERLAHLQYESLRAREGRALCEQVNDVREKMRGRLSVSVKLAPEEQRRQMAQRLDAWHHQVRLQDFVSQPLDDFGSLGSLREPLDYFREHEPLDAKELEQLLARLYAKLYIQQLLLPQGREVAEIAGAMELTRTAWRRRFAGDADFVRRVEKVEAGARWQRTDFERERQQKRLEALRKFIEASRKELERTAANGCGPDKPIPPELEAHLALLAEVLEESSADPNLAREFQKQSKALRSDLDRLEMVLARCPTNAAEPWRAEMQDSCLELARSLQRQLRGPLSQPRRGGD
jgi:hypothetical protein